MSEPYGEYDSEWEYWKNYTFTYKAPLIVKCLGDLVIIDHYISQLLELDNVHAA
jgi:hypothetical protein